MAQQPQTLSDALADLVAERGGEDKFTSRQMIAAKGLIRLMAKLAMGDTASSSGIDVLEKMLPPVPVSTKGPDKLIVEYVESAADLAQGGYEVVDLKRENAELRDKLRQANAKAGETQIGVAPPSKSVDGNVVPLAKPHNEFAALGSLFGNVQERPASEQNKPGNLVVSVPLHERYKGIPPL